MGHRARQHFPALDGLRGIGAALVMLLHISCVDPLTTLFSRGYLAVDFFFILSGFVIGHVYEAQMTGPDARPLSRYVRIRLARLYPLMAVGLILGIVNDGPKLSSDSLPLIILHVLTLPSFWAHGLLFALNSPEWSLYFELVANFVHALVCRLLTIAVLLGIVIVSALLLIATALHFGSADVGVSGENFTGGFPRVAFGFFTGVLIHRLWALGRLPRISGGAWKALVLFPAVVLLAGLSTLSRPLVDLVIIVGVFPALLCLALGDALPRVFEGAALFSGRLSYPIYAIHVPIIALVARWVPFAGEDVATRLGGWLLVLIVILAAAYCLERFYDRPVRRWLQTPGSRRLVRPLRRPTSQDAAPRPWRG